MTRTKYLIKNTKRQNYYQKKIFDNQKHFVADCTEAKQYASRKLANDALKTFNNKENYEIVAIKYEK